MASKRKTPARRGSAGKKVRIGGSSVISSPTTPSGRPRRSVAVDVNYKLTPTRSPKALPKKQAKIVKDKPTADTLSLNPKKRGRPSKVSTDTAPTEEATKTNAAGPLKAGRGRPRKHDSVPSLPARESSKRKREDEDPVTAPPKKRGRPSKNDVSITKPKEELSVKVKKGAASVKKAATEALTPTTNGSGRKGRPPGSKNKKTNDIEAGSQKKAVGPKKSTMHVTESFVDGFTQEDAEDAPDTQYWLMKAEPDSRIVKGIDVAFPIDKLAQATEPEPWDGVRNPVARNNMRAMRKGDLAFFYHSNCTTPGIVGVMRVVEEHSIDESAFDPAHPYYDEKSLREKPKWDCVKVEFVKKFVEPITLKQVKNTPELSTMQLAQKAFGRLSVQRVAPDQWHTVLKMANEPGDLGVVPLVSGYEADTNGETDREAGEESVGIDDVDNAKLAAYDSSDDLVNDNATITKDFDTNLQQNKMAVPLIDGQTVGLHEPRLATDDEDGNLASDEGA